MEKGVGIVDNRAVERLNTADRQKFLNIITFLQQFCNNSYGQIFIFVLI